MSKLPSWLHKKFIPVEQDFFMGLNTVCEEAKCPNIFECMSRKKATFLALGPFCSRACAFCNIKQGVLKEPLNKSLFQRSREILNQNVNLENELTSLKASELENSCSGSKNPRYLKNGLVQGFLKEPDKEEPKRIAATVKKLKLKHAVITMVSRDDLQDEGASHMAAIIEEVRTLCPNTTIEVLTSDFSGREELLDIVLRKKPDVFNHNLETVKRLSPIVRSKANYEVSLKVLRYASKCTSFIKSGLMVGLGESKEEVKEVLFDMKEAGCNIITIGQYLQPNPQKLPVKEFIHPDIFEELKQFGLSLGIKYVFSSPFIRSSYNSDQINYR